MRSEDKELEYQFEKWKKNATQQTSKIVQNELTEIMGQHIICTIMERISWMEKSILLLLMSFRTILIQSRLPSIFATVWQQGRNKDVRVRDIVGFVEVMGNATSEEHTANDSWFRRWWIAHLFTFSLKNAIKTWRGNTWLKNKILPDAFEVLVELFPQLWIC